MNISEEGMSQKQIKSIKDTIFKTKSGIWLLNTMYIEL